MNSLLKSYLVAVRFPDVSGAEHLQLLHTRDSIAAQEASFSSEERALLREADRRLLEQASAFYTELARFVDLSTYRTQQSIDPSRWWWYLDVISRLPLESAPPTALPHLG